MPELNIERRAAREATRMRRILRKAGADEQALTMAKPVIENTAWMKEKLDDARASIRESSVAIQYDNGGGQKGIRENPLYRGYEALWRSYTTGMQTLLDMLPEDEKNAAEAKTGQPATVLEVIRARRAAK